MTVDWLIPYLAGIFDGEGSISLRIRGRGIDAALQLSMTDEAPVRLLHQTFGGTFTSLGIPKRGRKPVYRWATWSTAAYAAVEMMLPYLLVKKRKGELLLALVNTGRHNGKAKLTAREIDEVREKAQSSGLRQEDIAEEYGISQAQVSKIAGYGTYRENGGVLTDEVHAKRLDIVRAFREEG